MTVSRVLNDVPKVGDAKRKAVLKAVAALRYAPNPDARALACGTQYRIGLLHASLGPERLSEFLMSSLDPAVRSSARLAAWECRSESAAVEVAVDMIAAGVQAVMMPATLCDAPGLLEMLKRHRIPIVAVGPNGNLDLVSSVSIDEHRAAFEMTRHLVSLGHTRIGFVTGDEHGIAGGLRLKGYLEALSATGIDRDPSLVAAGSSTYRSGLDAAEELLSRSSPPTAIFASSDEMAAAVVATAHRRSLDVPGDLTVCGFGDSAMATTIWPELTTIRQSTTALAVLAITVLIEALHGEQSPDWPTTRHLSVAHELVRRQSDAAPRRRPRAIPVPQRTMRENDPEAVKSQSAAEDHQAHRRHWTGPEE